MWVGTGQICNEGMILNELLGNQTNKYRVERRSGFGAGLGMVTCMEMRNSK